MRKVRSTVPRRIKCRLCGATFTNPIHQGSSIASVVCGDCKDEMLSKRKTKVKKTKRQPKKTSKIQEKSAVSSSGTSKSRLPSTLIGIARIG